MRQAREILQVKTGGCWARLTFDYVMKSGRNRQIRLEIDRFCQNSSLSRRSDQFEDNFRLTLGAAKL